MIMSFIMIFINLVIFTPLSPSCPSATPVDSLLLRLLSTLSLSCDPIDLTRVSYMRMRERLSKSIGDAAVTTPLRSLSLPQPQSPLTATSSLREGKAQSFSPLAIAIAYKSLWREKRRGEHPRFSYGKREEIT